MGTTDLIAGGGGLELKEGEAPEPDNSAVLETVRHGLGDDTKFDPSTKSTAPNKRFASWRLKWPESSGKRFGCQPHFGWTNLHACMFIATIIINI